MQLGCIGDDFTGSSDLANTLAKGGMSVVQYNGIPDRPATASTHAGVVALKTRSIPADDAVKQSLEALNWLKAQGCEQFFFKYCSTFDSTHEGNIGPVIDALTDALEATQVIVCPAYPATGRSIYMGHLFVYDTLLAESGMAKHPITPMSDSDIRRWLSHQTRQAVGHVPQQIVSEGTELIRKAISAESKAGRNLVVIDAIADTDLISIGQAVKDLALITGGSGIAMGLPRNFQTNEGLTHNEQNWTGETGPAAILSGSCSNVTRAQVQAHSRSHPALELDVPDIISGKLTTGDVAGWAFKRRMDTPLIYSSADPEKVCSLVDRYGSGISRTLEEFFGELSTLLVEMKFQRLVVAGGETSGAVVKALAPEELEIGPEIDPGVPALRVSGRNLTVALKSGNFGAPDFFSKAIAQLGGNK
jgi:uncharacterized protein YgbK (DUF1537 family)